TLAADRAGVRRLPHLWTERRRWSATKGPRPVQWPRRLAAWLPLSRHGRISLHPWRLSWRAGAGQLRRPTGRPRWTWWTSWWAHWPRRPSAPSIAPASPTTAVRSADAAAHNG